MIINDMIRIYQNEPPILKKINAMQPRLTVTSICAMFPTKVSIAALSLLPFSNMKIRPRKSPVRFGNIIPAVIPVKMAVYAFLNGTFSTGNIDFCHLRVSNAILTGIKMKANAIRSTFCVEENEVFTESHISVRS